MGNLPRTLRKDMAVAVRAEITAWLQQHQVFIAAISVREQCFYSCRILRKEHMPPVPLEFIGQGFVLEHGTIYNHWYE
jgi:hypothetical protein